MNSARLLFPFRHYFRCFAALHAHNSSTAAIRPTSELLRQISDAHNAKGRAFFLPWADAKAMQTIQLPIEELINIGVRPEFIVDACTKCDDLFVALSRNGAEVLKTLKIFVECMAMTYEDAIRFYAKWNAQLSDVTADSIQSRLSIFLGRGIMAGDQLRMLVDRCPQVLYMANAQQMDLFWEHISSFFRAHELKRLMQISPQLCLMDSKEVEEKYEYIYYHMGIESGELLASELWMVLDLEQLMMRHEFLLKTGKYTYPDPKKPQLKKENPSAQQIFDTTDTKFAREVACVSHEEWVVFQDLTRHEQLMAEKERPYEKVKPERRKSFDRRPKEEPTEVEGELKV